MAIPCRLFTLLTIAALAMSGAACARSESGGPRRAATVADSIDWPQSAPAQRFAVGWRTMAWQRGDRPLPTTIWYPAAGLSGGVFSRDTAAAMGRFPIVLLSHGLGGQPEGFADIASALAGDGFVVTAPAYPYTKKGSSAFDRNDVRNQPADGAFVLDEVAKLGRRMGDPFAGRLASTRMCAAGFSAGGTTTSGMFTQNRDRRLRCAVIISAGAMEGGFTGQAAPVLFLHGDADTVVNYSRGRSAHDKLTWPKAFMTMKGQGHGEFLDSKRAGFAPARAVIADFLRWNLYGDLAARGRLPGFGSLARVSTFEDRL
jgi:predicted dienelactone hydrolase